MVAAVVLLPAGLAGCSDHLPEPAEPPAAPVFRLEPDCPTPPPGRRSVSAAQLNQLGESLDLRYWQAADIGASARLHDGRLVWLFGDTVRKKGVVPGIVGNSMLVSSGRCVAQLVDDAHGPVVPDADRDTVRWPMSVAVARHGDHDVIAVLCSRTRRGSGGTMDFTFLGTTAAVFRVEDGGVPQVEKVFDLTPDSTDPDQVNWGAAAVVHGGWIYVFGTRLTGQQGVFGRELYVARTPVANPADRSGWEFRSAGGWQKDHRRAVAVLPAAGGVSQTLSVDVLDGTYVAVSKRDGDLGDFVYTWTAPQPWGPWTPRKALSAPAGFDTGDLQYAPLAHPEVPLTSGKLLVTISRNTTDGKRLLEDPELGRPKFAEIAP
ncbi:DUF4185 domain-containing protein [Nocardioides guangzhouensis]|uniref:DUF4185 domain-containing protein n=1 Tax=Nocardioides guangzhouensis TaxID=2497878 RepID=A0A4Q4Z4H3_9ACTN|nr:DUF4185 domain-containing protein [Nocardioides guangzhouensis]